MTKAASDRVRLNIPVSTEKHDDQDDKSDADTVDIMEEADVVLSVSPNASKPMDLSAYLVPDEPRPTNNAAEATPASLETQYTPWEDDSREVSDLLDYLNDLGFDSPKSLLKAHSHRKTPLPRTATGATPMSKNRDITTPLETPAPRKVLRDISNQTWPAGAKQILRKSPKSSTPRAERSNDERRGCSPSPQTISGPASRQETTNEDPNIIHGNEEVDSNSSSELDWDMSLEELLEETANAMLSSSSRKTWHFTEEEWGRLEKVIETTEFVLKEAQHERETAKKWATSVRESVLQWVSEQRALQQAHAESSTNDQVQLKATQEVLKQLKMELEALKTRHDAVTEELKAVIRRQADTIKELENKLLKNQAKESSGAFKTPGRPVSIASVRKSSTRVSQISLSPTVSQVKQAYDAETSNASSPTSTIDPITPTKHDALPNSVPTPMSMTVTPRTQRARTTLSDGGKLIVYRNGTEKELRPDGTVTIRFPNGDVKCTLGNEKSAGIVAYYHAKEQVWIVLHV